MKKQMMMRVAFLALVGVIVLGTASWAAPQKTVNERREAAADMRLEVDEIIVGSVVVTGWDEPAMLVTGTLGDDVESFEIDGSPASWEISVDWSDSERLGHRDEKKVNVDLEIRVPFGASIEVSAVTAPIKVTGVNGRIELETVTGKVEYSGESTRVEIDAVTGSIEARSSRLMHGSFETVQGDIEFEGSFDSQGSVSFESVMGSVELQLPADVAADFDVETMMGDVVNEHGPPARSESGFVPGKELSFSANGGGAKVSIETLQGAIRILKR